VHRQAAGLSDTGGMRSLPLEDGMTHDSVWPSDGAASGDGAWMCL
jgi:hypothetical protein